MTTDNAMEFTNISLNYTTIEAEPVFASTNSKEDNTNHSLHLFYWYQDLGARASYFLQEPHRVIALVLILMVVLSNFVSLAAMIHVRGKLTSHIRFLISLAMSDILVAVSVLFHVINKVVNPLYEPGVGPAEDRVLSRCLFVVIKALNTTGLNIALLNLIGMSVDAYIAVIKPHYYNTHVHYHRASIFIMCLWFVAFFCGFSDFLVSVKPFFKSRDIWRYQYNYCEVVSLSHYQEEYTVFATALVCLMTMTYMYTRIYFHVRCNTNSSQPNHSTQRSRRILLTTLLVIGTFVICWLPLCILNVSLIIIYKVNNTLLNNTKTVVCLQEVEYYLFDLLLLNGLFDPIIYTVRIREVQLAYRNMLCSACVKSLGFRRRSGTSLSFTSRQATFNQSEIMALSPE